VPHKLEDERKKTGEREEEGDRELSVFSVTSVISLIIIDR